MPDMMSDKERADGILTAYSTGLISKYQINNVLAEAFAAIRTEERERCAQIAEAYPGHPRKLLDWEDRIVRTIVGAIRNA